MLMYVFRVKSLLVRMTVPIHTCSPITTTLAFSNAAIRRLTTTFYDTAYKVSVIFPLRMETDQSCLDSPDDSHLGFDARYWLR